MKHLIDLLQLSTQEIDELVARIERAHNNEA